MILLLTWDYPANPASNATVKILWFAADMYDVDDPWFVQPVFSIKPFDLKITSLVVEAPVWRILGDQIGIISPSFWNLCSTTTYYLKKFLQHTPDTPKIQIWKEILS